MNDGQIVDIIANSRSRSDRSSTTRAFAVNVSVPCPLATSASTSGFVWMLPTPIGVAGAPPFAATREMRNPCGSVKDRLGVALIEDAERRGTLKACMTIVEATGGNTGIGLAFASAIRGYRLILTMPAAMSAERVALLRFLGAEVVLTTGILMEDAVAKARQIVAERGDAVMLDQFANPANPELHARTTGPEIWDDTNGAVDIFVAGVGTGGAITGVGRLLKQRKPAVHVVAG